MSICPSCEELNPANMNICKKCGATLPQVEIADEELSDFDKEILGLIQSRHKIEAIKLYREKTGLGLKEAKDAVEALASKHGIVSKGAGCASVVLLLFFIPVVWWLF